MQGVNLEWDAIIEVCQQLLQLLYTTTTSYPQHIKSGKINEVKEWFEEVTAGRNINKVVDNSDGELENLKSTLQREGTTALHYAAFYSQLEIVNFLLEKGAGNYVFILGGEQGNCIPVHLPLPTHTYVHIQILLWETKLRRMHFIVLWQVNVMMM